MEESRKTVLIVEDDLILNLLYESYMDKLRFATKGELVQGINAIEMVRELNPDLILMDIALEGDLDGIDTMKEIRSFSDVPVIYVTGNSDQKHRQRAKEVGYIEYLIKPIDFEDLKEAVHKLFNNHPSS
ncbi:MAG: response regulator [Balneolaceae bacterium]